MSVITQVYNALSEVAVTTTGGVTPTVFDLDELPQSVSTAQLPCRLLLPVGNEPGEGREGTFIAVGTSMVIIWTINDLMLWQPINQGTGLKEFAPELVDYAGKYIDAMRTFGKCPYANTTLESVSISPGVYEWPASSGNNYAGVKCQLQIREVLSG